jgi:hypothetical protein
MGMMEKLNKSAMEQVIQLDKEGKLGSKVYACNLEKEKQIQGPRYPMHVISHLISMKKGKKLLKD